MVVPSFSALFSSAPPDTVDLGQLLSYECPTFCAILAHELDDGIVLL